MDNDALHKFLAGSHGSAGNTRAASRHRQLGRAHIALAEWLAEWIPEPRRGRALEIGAGVGLFTERLLPWAGSLLATDASPAMCAAGREALPDAAWSVVSPTMLEGSGWDWMFSCGMLRWTTRPAKVLMGWRERLAPKGRALVGVFAAESLPELRTVVGPEGLASWRSVEAWRADALAAGFRIERESVERRTIEYASALELWRSLRASGTAPDRRVDRAQLRRWLRDYTERFRLGNGVAATWTFYRFEGARP